VRSRHSRSAGSGCVVTSPLLARARGALAVKWRGKYRLTVLGVPVLYKQTRRRLDGADFDDAKMRDGRMDSRARAAGPPACARDRGIADHEGGQGWLRRLRSMSCAAAMNVVREATCPMSRAAADARISGRRLRERRVAQARREAGWISPAWPRSTACAASCPGAARASRGRRGTLWCTSVSRAGDYISVILLRTPLHCSAGHHRGKTAAGKSLPTAPSTSPPGGVLRR